MKPIVFALFLVPGMAIADPLYITIPGEGWTLKLDTPPMTSTRASSKGRLYQYMASSLDTGVTLSVHTETVGAGSNEECRETYWTKSKESPTIKGDISLTGNETALFVTHHAEAVLQGKAHKTANGHAYFVKNGLCVDLHVSHWPYQPGSEKRVDSVLKSVSFAQ